MRRIHLISLVLMGALMFSSCEKTEDCLYCGYFTGLSRTVDYLPGTTTGHYATTSATYEVARAGEGYRTSYFTYIPDANGVAMVVVDSADVEEVGYESLTVRLYADSMYFLLDKTDGRYEEFRGTRIP